MSWNQNKWINIEFEFKSFQIKSKIKIKDKKIQKYRSAEEVVEPTDWLPTGCALFGRTLGGIAIASLLMTLNSGIFWKKNKRQKDWKMLNCL
jgi:hypothetical protein